MDDWIRATWKIDRRRISGWVKESEYGDPFETRRGKVCAFRTDEEISFDDLPGDAYVIIGADVDYVAPGDILSVPVRDIRLL